MLLFIAGFVLGISLGNFAGSSRTSTRVHFTIAYSSEKAMWMGEIQGKFMDWWILTRPPMDGLHGMTAILLLSSVKSNVLDPIPAAAQAASTPAWPAPTTMTSNVLDSIFC